MAPISVGEGEIASTASSAISSNSDAASIVKSGCGFFSMAATGLSLSELNTFPSAISASPGLTWPTLGIISSLTKVGLEDGIVMWHLAILGIVHVLCPRVTASIPPCDLNFACCKAKTEACSALAEVAKRPSGLPSAISVSLFVRCVNSCTKWSSPSWPHTLIRAYRKARENIFER